MQALPNLANRHGAQLSKQQESFAQEQRYRVLLVHEHDQPLDNEITDLQSCGLPANTEAMIFTVTALHKLLLHWTEVGNGALSIENRQSHRSRGDSTAKLKLASSQARAKLLTAFPLWNIHNTVSAKPRREMIEQALLWQPDLIVIAEANPSITRSRAFRGIMRKLVTEANFSLRVSRPQEQIWSFRRPTVIAFDGSASADAVSNALTRRPWCQGREIKLFFCMEAVKPDAARSNNSHAAPDREQIARLLLQTKIAIEALGHRVSSLVSIDNTAQAILEEARRVDAEGIFIGNGTRGVLADLVAQSVAATVAANAPCPVEIVCRARSAQTVWAKESAAA